MKKYRVVTLWGSTRFKEEFMEVQKKLTLDGMIVISVGLFGHSGDKEVSDGMSEGEVSETKMMLDDMHKSKIDMSDAIFVINPNGYIGESTWSEIVYAAISGKDMIFLEQISDLEIDKRVELDIEKARLLAYQQLDIWKHTAADFPGDTVWNDMVILKHKNKETICPWIVENEEVDPFEEYGDKKMARFIADILLRHNYTGNGSAVEDIAKKRIELKEEVEFYHKHLGIKYPKGYPNNITIDELIDFLSAWREYNPCPDLR